MSPEDPKMAAQLQSNEDFTHNCLCYDEFARNARPKPFIPRTSRGRGYPLAQFTQKRRRVV